MENMGFEERMKHIRSQIGFLDSGSSDVDNNDVDWLVDSLERAVEVVEDLRRWMPPKDFKITPSKDSEDNGFNRLTEKILNFNSNQSYTKLNEFLKELGVGDEN